MMPRCRGGHLLAKWLKENGRTQMWLAGKLGLAHVQVWRILTGGRSPHIDVAVAIEKLTKIPVAVWSKPRAKRPVLQATRKSTRPRAA